MDNIFTSLYQYEITSNKLAKVNVATKNCCYSSLLPILHTYTLFYCANAKKISW